MAKKMPRKDINLYTLVVGPKKSTMKKGVLFAVIGILAVVLLGGGFAAAKVYAVTQEKIASELEAKTNDPALQEKLQHVNDLAQDIATMRTAGNAYSTIRTEIEFGARSNCDDFTLDLVEQLVSCEDYSVGETTREIATITGLSFDGQTLQITAQSVDSRNVSFFVSNLVHLGIFSDVSYDSYTLSETSYTYVVNAVFTAHDYTEETTEAGETGETTETTEEANAQ